MTDSKMQIGTYVEVKRGVRYQTTGGARRSPPKGALPTTAKGFVSRHHKNDDVRVVFFSGDWGSISADSLDAPAPRSEVERRTLERKRVSMGLTEPLPAQTADERPDPDERAALREMRRENAPEPAKPAKEAARPSRKKSR